MQNGFMNMPLWHASYRALSEQANSLTIERSCLIGMNPFYEEVYRFVKKIPYGKVASYSQIAWALGRFEWCTSCRTRHEILPRVITSPSGSTSRRRDRGLYRRRTKAAAASRRDRL